MLCRATLQYWTLKHTYICNFSFKQQLFSGRRWECRVSDNSELDTILSLLYEHKSACASFHDFLYMPSDVQGVLVDVAIRHISLYSTYKYMW